MRLPLYHHHQLLTPHPPFKTKSKSIPSSMSLSPPLFNSLPKFPSSTTAVLIGPTTPLHLRAVRFRFLCYFNGSGYPTTTGNGPFMGPPLIGLSYSLSVHSTQQPINYMMSQLELGKSEEKRKPVKRVNGIFWIILLNLGIYVADHLFQVQGVRALYLHHNWPAWYQFVTSTFCHANWNHLSSNLFFLYIFGKLVEEEEGNFGLWLSYIITGAGANLVSWLVLPRSAVSVGASGAVFGLFAISVLVKMSWDWRKLLEVLILGQFVIEKVMQAAQGSTGLSSGGYALQNVNHIAHLSGALMGVALVCLLSTVSSQPPPPDRDVSITQKKSD